MVFQPQVNVIGIKEPRRSNSVKWLTGLDYDWSILSGAKKDFFMTFTSNFYRLVQSSSTYWIPSDARKYLFTPQVYLI